MSYVWCFQIYLADVDLSSNCTQDDHLRVYNAHNEIVQDLCLPEGRILFFTSKLEFKFHISSSQGRGFQIGIFGELATTLKSYNSLHYDTLLK